MLRDKQRSVTIVAITAFVLLSAVVGMTAAAGAQDAGTGPTQAPDLQNVSDFSERSTSDGPGNQTLVQFTFDEPVNVVGDPADFQLVRINGSVEAGNEGIVDRTNDDRTLTVPFPGRIDPANIARGFVDANTVRVAGEGDGATNPKQAAHVSNNGTSVNPDLVSVSTGGENELRFIFDEEITEIGSAGSFRFYYSNATVQNSLDATVTNDSNVVVAEYAPKFNVRSGAVGASVTNGAVSGTDTTREDGDTNQFDEVTISAPIVGNDTPTDPDGDGRFEDIDGDGEVSITDVQALFVNLDAIAERDDAERFDFNGDGEITIADVQALFVQQTGSGGGSDSPPEPVVGNETPTDPDDDGLYEDIDGDGEVNIVDVQRLFVNLDAIAQRDDAERFDFNDDGDISIADVQALFVQS